MLAGGGAATAARRARRADRPPGPWTALLALPVVALAIPSSLVLAGPLRSNGWPARLMVFWIAGMVLLGWLVRRRSGSRALTLPTAPAEAGAWLLVLALCSALGAGGMRELTDVESAGALRFALALIPLAVLAIGVSTLADSRLCDLLMAGLALGAGVGAMIAVAQFLVPFAWDQVLQIPPLQADDASAGGSRGGFARIRGAADHPIELGVICGSAVPLALHFARFATSRQRRVGAALLSTLLIVCIPMSVSRSGILVVGVAIAVYAVTFNARQRLTALVLTVAGMAVFRAAVPGLLGTVVSIFRGASGDDSITGRTEDYAVVNELWTQHPFLGYGLGTFRPEEFFFLDNQYLMALVEGGITLLMMTIVFFLLAVASARGAVRRAVTPSEASRGQAVAAALVAIAISGLFFDLFSFAQITVVTFVLAGVAGALWHHGVLYGQPLPSPAQRFARARSGAAAFVPQPGAVVPTLHSAPCPPGGDGSHGEEDGNLGDEVGPSDDDVHEDRRRRASPG